MQNEGCLCSVVCKISAFFPYTICYKIDVFFSFFSITCLPENNHENQQNHQTLAAFAAVADAIITSCFSSPNHRRDVTRDDPFGKHTFHIKLVYLQIVFTKQLNQNWPYVNRLANGQFEGFCIDLLNELAPLMGMAYTLSPVADGQYGGWLPANGTVNGMVGEVMRGVSILLKPDCTIFINEKL